VNFKYITFFLYRRKIVNHPLTEAAVYCIRQSPWKAAEVNNTSFVSRNIVSDT
jgi:hypothetical protein